MHNVLPKATFSAKCDQFTITMAMVTARILVSSMLVQMMTLSFLGGAEPAAVTAQVLPTLSEHH